MYMNYIPYTHMVRTNPNIMNNKNDNILPKPLVLDNGMKQNLIHKINLKCLLSNI